MARSPQRSKAQTTLPEKAYATLLSDRALIIGVIRGEPGYHELDKMADEISAQALVDKLNQAEGVTKAQAAAMVAGSLFGWNTPIADPRRYDDNGRLV